MAHRTTQQATHQQAHSTIEREQFMEAEQSLQVNGDDSVSSNSQLESEIQPEEGTPRSADEKQIRGRSESGTARVEQNAGDDVGGAPEEA